MFNIQDVTELITRNQAMFNCIKEGGRVSYIQIDQAKKGLPVGEWFVADDDPAHPTMHPDDEYLVLLEAKGQIIIDRTNRAVVFTG